MFPGVQDGLRDAPALQNLFAGRKQCLIAAHGINVDDSKYEVTIETPYNGDDSLIEVELEADVGYFLGPVVGIAGAIAHGRSVADADTLKQRTRRSYLFEGSRVVRSFTQSR